MTRSEAIESAARALADNATEFASLRELVEAVSDALALPPDPPPTCVTCEREAAPDPPAPGERCPCCGKESQP